MGHGGQVEGYAYHLRRGHRSFLRKHANPAS